jgi:hypothetical protein
LKKPTTPEEIVRQVVRFLLSPGAKESDAAWLMNTLADDADLTQFFRAEVSAELDRRATRNGTLDRGKRRKIFYSLSGVARAIFGSEYEATKRSIDAASKAALESQACTGNGP